MLAEIIKGVFDLIKEVIKGIFDLIKWRWDKKLKKPTKKQLKILREIMDKCKNR